MKENLVFDKHARQLIGFIDVGDIHNHLDNSERQCIYGDKNANANSGVSTHMLMFMVRGLLTDLEFPYALFSTKGASADVLFPIVLGGCAAVGVKWFQVIAFNCDGASPNRKMYRIQEKGKEMVYKTKKIPTLFTSFATYHI